MSAKSRLMKLEKTKRASNPEQIHVVIVHPCPDDPGYVIIDGERISKIEHERRNQALEASGETIIKVGIDLEKV